MTPARKAALQWFHDRGEVPSLRGSPFGAEMLMRMERGAMEALVRPCAGWRFIPAVADVPPSSGATRHLLPTEDVGRSEERASFVR